MTEEEKPDLLIVWEFLGGRVPHLKGFGWSKAHCALHDDRTASAAVNEELQRWRCYSCDMGGDVYELVKEAEHTDGFPDTKRRAQEIAGEGNGKVSSGSDSRGRGVSNRSGHRPGRRAWQPSWVRSRGGSGA